MELRTGEVVERYEVLEPLGEGGMAAVYLVRHSELGSAHALKIVTASSPSIRDRLLVEGRAQATLRHANIVAVTDTVVCRGAPGLIMEYVAGPSLQRWLRAERPSFEDAMAVFGGILRGVARAHRKDFVHRDLKPDNVLLDVDDDDVVPKVADFGIAKVLSEAGRTVQGSKMGTPAFMAPEQLSDAAAVDKRADIFSLGAILYELVTGARAFEGSNPADVLQNIARVQYKPVWERWPEVPDRVAAVIEGCLTRFPEERWASCEELREGLGEHYNATGRLDPDGPGGLLARHLATSASSRMGNHEAPVEEAGTWGGSFGGGSFEEPPAPAPAPADLPPASLAGKETVDLSAGKQTVDLGSGKETVDLSSGKRTVELDPPPVALDSLSTGGQTPPTGAHTGAHTGALVGAAVGLSGVGIALLGTVLILLVAGAWVFWPVPEPTAPALVEALPTAEPAPPEPEPPAAKPQPAPIGRTVPVHPKPGPEVDPWPTEDAAPEEPSAPAATGMVTVVSSYSPPGIALVGKGGRHPVDQAVPVGSYTVVRDGPSGQITVATVDVRADVVLELNCLRSGACQVSSR